MKEWTTPDFRNTPSTTGLVEDEIVDALGNDVNASMPEQVNRPNPWRKMMMMMMTMLNFVLRRVYSLSQNGFSTECDILLPLAVSSNLSFPQRFRSCLRLLLRLLVPYILTSITCFKGSSYARYEQSTYLSWNTFIAIIYLIFTGVLFSFPAVSLLCDYVFILR